MNTATRGRRGGGRPGRPKGSKTKLPPPPPPPTEFKCPVCSAVYPKQDQLMSHKVTEHSDIYEFECGQCDNVFDSLDGLQAHFFEVHMVGGGKVIMGASDTAPVPHVASVTAANDNAAPVLVAQERSPAKVASTGGSSSMITRSSDKAPPIPDPAPPHLSPQWTPNDDYSDDGGGYDDPGNDSDYEPPQTSPVKAPVKTPVKYPVKKQLPNPEPPPNHVPRSIITQSAAQLTQSTTLKPFQCEFCPKSYAFKYDLTIHQRTHSGVRPYKCNVCDKTFNVHRTLTDHLRRHNKAYRYFCEVVGCGKGFATSNDRNRHEIRHVPIHLRPPDKTYQCEICSKFFTQRVHLTAHIKFIHERKEGSHACKLCGKKFRQLSNLQTHMLSIKHGGTGVSYRNKKKPKKPNPNPKKRGRKPKNRAPDNDDSSQQTVSSNVSSEYDQKFDNAVQEPSGQVQHANVVHQNVGYMQPVYTVTLQDAFQMGYGIGNN